MYISKIITIVILSVFLINCIPERNNSSGGILTIQSNPQVSKPILNAEGTSIWLRFNPPVGYERQTLASGSFGQYLRRLSLKPHGTPAYQFDGEEKWSQDVHAAVIDLPIGKKDLHQCADAIMHVRARYLYQNHQYDAIGFHFVNGFYCDYEHWRKGYRVSVKGNKTQWVMKSQENSSEESFWKYLETVFMYASTLSLEKELEAVDLNELSVGDVFIQGGSPGHAILVVDVAVNPESGSKMFLLAQSYMPAQEMHVLHNYQNEGISPWYDIKRVSAIVSTPEWSFYPTDLKRFP